MPGNADKGMTNHQSTVFLFDPDTGRPTAMVGGNLLTALRTAAASAVSIDQLARQDAAVLGMVGAGHQAGFQLRAAAKVRKFEEGRRLEPAPRHAAQPRQGRRKSLACRSRPSALKTSALRRM